MEKGTKKIRILYILMAACIVILIGFFLKESKDQKTIMFGVDAKEVAYMTVSYYPVLHGDIQKITDKEMIQELLSEANKEEFYYWGSKEKRQNQKNVIKSSNNTCFRFYNQQGKCIGKIQDDSVCGGYTVAADDGYYIFSGEDESLERATGEIIDTCKERSGR